MSSPSSDVIHRILSLITILDVPNAFSFESFQFAHVDHSLVERLNYDYGQALAIDQSLRPRLSIKGLLFHARLLAHFHQYDELKILDLKTLLRLRLFFLQYCYHEASTLKDLDRYIRRSCLSPNSQLSFNLASSDFVVSEPPLDNFRDRSQWYIDQGFNEDEIRLDMKVYSSTEKTIKIRIKETSD